MLAALAWWSPADQMAGMDAGPGTDLGTLGFFIGVWVVMMAAMMFPSIAPMVVMLRGSRRGGERGARRSARPLLFVGGYLLVWARGGPGRLRDLSELGRALIGETLLWHAGGRSSPAAILPSPRSTSSRR